jgi:hypothetical protein
VTSERDRSELFSWDEETVEPFRVTPGFIAFIAVACLPAIIALAVFFGAWMVSSDVEAAEAKAAPGDSADVAGWKTTLVGICPVH